MTIYTRTGDTGETYLCNSRRVSKSAVAVEVLGELDELNAVLGFARSALKGSYNKDLSLIQMDLFILGTAVAGLNLDNKALDHLKNRILWMENKIDRLEQTLPSLSNFILPAGCEASVRLHLARTICRRCERRLVSLKSHTSLIPYLNRLGDFLFVLARYQNFKNKQAEELVKKLEFT